MAIQRLRSFNQKPLGQVLLATLLFCFIFLALFVGLYKSGQAYIVKERSRRAVNLTVLTGGAVYANGLQLVREANITIMGFAAFDAAVIAQAIGEALLAPPPLDVAAVALAAEKADPHSRTPAQNIFATLFGVDTPAGAGAYPALIASQTYLTANENSLSSQPFFVYNYETAKDIDAIAPNMALRFRYADEFLPDNSNAPYSLTHNGIRHYFYSDQVEPANNPRHPKQMRVKKFSTSEFAGWWVRRDNHNQDKNGENNLSGHNPFAGIPGISVLRKYLHQFKLDITDRDNPACHTFSILGSMKTKTSGQAKDFYEAGEVRLESNGISAWDTGPIQTYLAKVDIDAFPVLRESLQGLRNTPLLNNILKSSDLLNGI